MKLQIPPRSSQCSKGHAFDNPVVSQLFKDDEGLWTRQDFCEKCAEKNSGVYCTWHSTVHTKKPLTTPLLELFRTIQDPDELSFLGEVLLRQKQLLRRSRTKTEQVLEDAVTGDVYILERRDLSLSQVRHLSVKYL